MANKFEKKEWIDRQSEFPSRRRMTPTSITDVFEVDRAEGTITEIGNAFDAENCNDTEERIYSAFGNLDDTDIKITDKNNVFTGTWLDEVLFELFQYAVSGKAAIAAAIGGISSSSTWQALANAITALKTSYQNTINTLNSTVSSLNTEIINGKTAISNAIGDTKSGRMSTSLDFNGISGFISDNTKSYYNGTFQSTSISATGGTNYYHVNMNFGFLPSNLYLYNFTASITDSNGFFKIAFLSVNNYLPRSTSGISVNAGIDNISASGFDIWVYAPASTTVNVLSTETYLLAIG